MEIRVTITIDDDQLKELLGLQSNPTARKIYEPCIYARFFEGEEGWDREATMAFLREQQQYATRKLRTQGYLFLNEVYDLLNISRTKVGQCIGWVYDEANPIGDNFVDFGIHNDINKEFVNGRAKSALLDFNVDGNILEYLKD